MKVYVPDYYKEFQCIAGACENTCCRGWEIDIDAESLERFKAYPEIMKEVSLEGDPHFRMKGEDCPFLRQDGLCQMILDHGEDFLCQICTDHPRFRNFWTGRIEVGLGMACETAARLILGRTKSMELVILEEDGGEEPLPEDEAWLMDLRQQLLEQVEGNGPEARLLEYLIYRHIPDALYDDRLEERIAFIQESYNAVLDAWEETEGGLEALVKCAAAFSVDHEYFVPVPGDEEE